MENDDVVTMWPERKKPFFLFRLWQWLVAVCYGLLAVVVAWNWAKLSLPGAPEHLYWPTLALLSTLTLIHIPHIFFRLPGSLKTVAYLGLIAGFVMAGTFAGQVQTAYERTPQGQKEAVAREIEEKENAAATRQSEVDKAKMDELEEATQKLSDLNDKIEGCFSWGHRLPALETQVQESLHNPDSFEQVETVSVLPDEKGYNIVMQFRAENGFGAIRIGTAKARLIADDCGLDGVIIEN